MRSGCGVVLLALALMPAAMFSAAQPVTLTVTAAPSIFQPMYREIFDAFERANPDIKIALRASTREYDQLAEETLLSALSRDLPDLSIQGANRLRLLVDRHLAISLDPLIQADPEWNALGVGPMGKEAGTIKGQTYGLGFSLSFPAVYYNLDLMGRVGCDPAHMPTTWTEILSLARKIRAANPKFLGGFFQYANGWSLVTLIKGQGGRVMTGDDSVLTLNTSEGLQGLEILREFGKLGQAELDMTHDQARQAFAAGVIGILIDSSSNLRSFERQAAGNFQIGVGPFPLQAGTGRLEAFGAVTVMFARDPNRQRAAWRCMKFLSGPTAQTILARRTSYVSVNTVALASPDLDQQRPSKQVLLSQLPHLAGWYAFPGAYSIKIESMINDHVQQVVELTQSPQEALKRMTQEIEPLLPPSVKQNTPQ